MGLEDMFCTCRCFLNVEKRTNEKNEDGKIFFLGAVVGFVLTNSKRNDDTEEQLGKRHTNTTLKYYQYKLLGHLKKMPEDQIVTLLCQYV